MPEQLRKNKRKLLFWVCKYINFIDFGFLEWVLSEILARPLKENPKIILSLDFLYYTLNLSIKLCNSSAISDKSSPELATSCIFVVCSSIAAADSSLAAAFS